LSGALIAYYNIPSGGTLDYCSEKTAMPFTDTLECISAIENPDFSKVAKMQKLLREKIGSRVDNMKKFVNLIK